MSIIIKPEHYHALLDMHKTEQGIKLIKDFFRRIFQLSCACAASQHRCSCFKDSASTTISTV